MKAMGEQQPGVRRDPALERLWRRMQTPESEAAVDALFAAWPLVNVDHDPGDEDRP